MKWLKIRKVWKEREEFEKQLDERGLEILKKAEIADMVLQKLGIANHTETGKQIRGAIALELLGSEYEILDKKDFSTKRGIFPRTNS